MTEAAPRYETLPLDRISDPGAQMRVEMSDAIIAEYAAEMMDGAKFPPVVVYHDGENYWLADGYHRKEAAKQAGRETIEAEVRDGTARDAILTGIGANTAHGLRRTNADKRRAVERLLTDPEWAQWSDRQIAKAARVDHKTVASVRRELSGEIPTPAPRPVPSTGKPSGPASGSILHHMLRTVSDADLIAECRRRNLTVEAGSA